MKLFRYWAVAEQSITDTEGNHLRLRKWGGSNDNEAAAQDTARQAVAALAQRLMTRAEIRNANEYTYSTRDLPEELLETIDGHNGITRNRYGCQVLNSANMLIADIDFRMPGFFGWLLHRHKRPKDETEALTRLKGWLQQHPEAHALVYRTAAGLRYLFTHAPVAPDPQALDWLKDMGADRLYIFLCREQQCFRARLTPKPWRCGQDRPPSQWYPFRDSAAENIFRSWLSAYESKARSFATCQFAGQHGSGHVEPSLQRIVDTHDRMTGARSNLPLA